MFRRTWKTWSVVIVSCTSILTVAAGAQQGQPQIGIAPVTLSNTPYTFDTAEQHRIRVVVMARGLAHPFSLAFLPNGDALVTERGARLRIVRGATGSQPKLETEPVAGTPTQPAFRGGGLQEIALHPKFAANQLVYFTYNKAGAVGQNPNQRQSAVTLARGRFDGKAITAVEDIFTGDWSNGASGSRLVQLGNGAHQVPRSFRSVRDRGPRRPRRRVVHRPERDAGVIALEEHGRAGHREPETHPVATLVLRRFAARRRHRPDSVDAEDPAVEQGRPEGRHVGDRREQSAVARPEHRQVQRVRSQPFRVELAGGHVGRQ